MLIKLFYGKPQAPALVTGKIEKMSLVRPVNTSLCLEKMCETNYQKLFRLIPELCTYNQHAVGNTQSKPALYIEILERSNHTLTIELSHCFNHQLDTYLEPAVKIRIYLDAQLAEVIRDHARSDVNRAIKDPSKTTEIRDYKWQLNYFLSKWLDHCLLTDYQFKEEHRTLAIA